MSHWWTDTLAKRLFLLLWLTLLAGHGLGMWLMHPAPPPPMSPMEPMPPPPFMGWDTVVRLAVMGVAAWAGAAWLTRPMQQLAQAALHLGQSMTQPVGTQAQRSEPMCLDDSAGPLEVRQMARSFNDMACRLQSQFEERSLLMGAVSHDLRTPLTRLRMRLERLQPDPVVDRCVQDIRDINALIEGVLDALNEERQFETPVPIDGLALVQAMVDDLAEQGMQASMDEVPMAELTAWAQPVALQRVLSNLISNALRYGQQAKVSVGTSQDRWHITVDDCGPGIPEAMLNEVFKPFVRLDPSRNRDSGGVGLGLYIARELTWRQGGQLTLSNRPEGGLRAILNLPLKDQTTTGSGSSLMPKRP